MTTRKELTEALRERYCSGTFSDEIKILDEFVALTGYHSPGSRYPSLVSPIEAQSHLFARVTLCTSSQIHSPTPILKDKR